MFFQLQGIEAEAVMLGQAISMLLPQVIGYKLVGTLNKLVTSTDLVLTITKVCYVTLFWHIFILSKITCIIHKIYATIEQFYIEYICTFFLIKKTCMQNYFY